VTFQIKDKDRSNEDFDKVPSQKLEAIRDIQEITKKLEEAIHKAGKETGGSRNMVKQKAKGKTVPWWTNGLTIMEKKRRIRYQQTTSNEALRESRKTQYNKLKVEYQVAKRKEKTRSWKENCTTTSPFNPWNEVYKLASNKI
jgi:hypothetical protein